MMRIFFLDSRYVHPKTNVRHQISDENPLFGFKICPPWDMCPTISTDSRMRIHFLDLRYSTPGHVSDHFDQHDFLLKSGLRVHFLDSRYVHPRTCVRPFQLTWLTSWVSNKPKTKILRKVYEIPPKRPIWFILNINSNILGVWKSF